MKTFPALMAAFLLAGQCQAAETPTLCKVRTDLAGRSVVVRGRLSLWNGAPRLRLWRAGTRRVLGVITDREGDPAKDFAGLPPDVQHSALDDPAPSHPLPFAL